METKILREKLHQYVDQSDEKFLKMVYALAKEYYEEDDFEYDFTEEEKKIFDERRKKRLSGESKTYSWEEAKEIITDKDRTQ